jgi:hypothetical protein
MPACLPCLSWVRQRIMHAKAVRGSFIYESQSLDSGLILRVYLLMRRCDRGGVQQASGIAGILSAQTGQHDCL